MKRYVTIAAAIVVLGISGNVFAANAKPENNNLNFDQRTDDKPMQFSDNQSPSANQNENNNDVDEFAEMDNMDNKEKALQEGTKFAWNNSDNDPDQIDALVKSKNDDNDDAYSE